MKDLRKVKDHTDFVTFPAMHTHDKQCKQDVQSRQKMHGEGLHMHAEDVLPAPGEMAELVSERE